MRSNIMRFVPISEARKLGVGWKLLFWREERKFNKPGLYLIELGDGTIKVGISKNVQNRLFVYLSDSPKRAIMYAASQPRRLELKVINHYKLNALPGSIERISGVTLESVMKFIEQDPYYKVK